MKLQLPKGVRDFPPQEKILRDSLVEKLVRIFRLYGFNPLETPMFERFDILSGKYSGGAEILKETFKFKDQGERDLGLRYDLTVPFARFVGMNPQLKMPFKRYAIGKVFRDGPLKLGRYREFYQCDVDIVGAKGMAADAECVKIALSVFEELGIKVKIVVNNRKLLEELLSKGEVKKEQLTDAMLVLDKIKKVGLDMVKKELEEKGIPEEAVDVVVRIATADQSTTQKITEVRNYLGESEGVEEIAQLLGYLEDERVEFDPSLARGLAYYTGTVFEGFAVDSQVTSSLCGGGRYDNMIAQLLSSKQEYPTVGISFGLEPIMDVLSSKENKKSVVQVYLIPIKTTAECMSIAAQLRKAGIATDMDLLGKSISKNLDYANSYEIPYVVIAGKQELESGKVKLKDMKSGEEKLISVDEVKAQLSN